MNTAAPVIDLNGVTLSFSADAGVYDLNFHVPAGTIFGLIGPSGSGKTTTVRLMTGVYQPTEGQMTVLGHEPKRFSTRIREQIGYMPQLFTLYPNLTVRENLNFVASLYGIGYLKRRDRIKQLLEFVELDDAQHRLAHRLSGGMQRRLLLACALVHDPTLIFADEPTAGIDPVLRGRFWEYFRELRDAGHTLFVTTQYVGEAAYCDMVGVMRDGRMLHVNTPEALRQTALGGEVLRLVVDQTQLLNATQLIERQPWVSDVRRVRGEPGMIQVYVDHADERLPQLISLLNDQPQMTVRKAEEYLPPFDDVFVALMEQAETNHV